MLQDINVRLQALERIKRPAVNNSSQTIHGPPDEAKWDCSSPYLSSQTTLCVLPLLCGVPPPLGQFREIASNKLKHDRITQADAPRRSQPESTDDQTPRLLTREEEKRIKDDSVQRPWRSQQQPGIQTTPRSQQFTWQNPTWTENDEGAQSTTNSNSM